MRDEEQNEPLFQFLHDSILAVDRQTTGAENFALVFLLGLATYLGFGISTGAELTDQVIMAGHAPTAKGATGPATLRLREFEGYFDELLRDPTTSTIPNGRVRHELLHVVIRYYQLHVEQLGEIRSLDILSQVLN